MCCEGCGKKRKITLENRRENLRRGGLEKAFALREECARDDGGCFAKGGDRPDRGGPGLCEDEAGRCTGGAQTKKPQGRSAGSGANSGDRGLQEDGGVDTSLSPSAADPH